MAQVLQFISDNLTFILFILWITLGVGLMVVIRRARLELEKEVKEIRECFTEQEAVLTELLAEITVAMGEDVMDHIGNAVYDEAGFFNIKKER